MGKALHATKGFRHCLDMLASLVKDLASTSPDRERSVGDTTNFELSLCAYRFDLLRLSISRQLRVVGSKCRNRSFYSSSLCLFFPHMANNPPPSLQLRSRTKHLLW